MHYMINQPESLSLLEVIFTTGFIKIMCIVWSPVIITLFLNKILNSVKTIYFMTKELNELI